MALSSQLEAIACIGMVHSVIHTVLVTVTITGEPPIQGSSCIKYISERVSIGWVEIVSVA